MRLFFCGVLLVALLSVDGKAQDSTKVKPRAYTHYFGLQANQLLRQLFDFGGSSTVPANAYSLVFSFNSPLTGAGMNTGFGYTFNEFNDGDATNKRETKINDFFLRVGYEKKRSLGKRWLASTGIDVVVDRQRNETENTTDFGSGNRSKINSKTKISAWGLGPRITLNFKVSERIYIGTEATYYFKSIKDERIIESEITSQIFDPFTGQIRLQTTRDKDEVESKNKRFSFASPAVLFLLLKW